MNNNISTSTHEVIQAITVIFNYIDLVLRCCSSSVFLVYFLILAFRRDWKARHLWYTHQVNLANFMYILMYLGFFNSTTPSTKWPLLNKVLCTTVEIIFGILKFLRPYSILLLTLNRFVGEYFIPIHKYLKRSRKVFYYSFIVVWALSVVFSLAIKFGFKTTYYPKFCHDGFSSFLGLSIGYLIVSIFLGFLVPCITSLFLCYLIKIKMINAPGTNNFLNRRRETVQTYAFNACSVLSFSITYAQSFMYYSPDTEAYLYCVQQLLRIINLLLISSIQILSFHFNPKVFFMNLKVSVPSTKIYNIYK